jgi:cytochrome c biogenesis protein CcdA
VTPFLVTAVVLSHSADAASQDEPRIKLPRPEWDFGTVKEGATLTRTFPVENASQAPLHIHRVRGSCTCFELSIDAEVLQPGAQGTLTVVVDTDDRHGKFRKFVYIESDDPQCSRARIRITGRIERARRGQTQKKPQVVNLEPAKRSSDPKPVCITCFTSLTCEECRETHQALETLQKTHATVAVREFDVDDLQSYALLLRLEKAHGRVEHAPPIVYVGTTLLDGWDEVHVQLDPLVRTRLNDGKAAEWPPEVSAAAEESGWSAMALVRQKFRTIGPLAVVGAGLVDGVNPCAFATIVFFVSLLARFGKSRRETVLVGLCFTIGVFATYFLLGLGFLKAIQAFSVTAGIAKAITYVIAALAVALGFCSLYDYLVWRRTRSGADMKLRLPHTVQRRIHDVMKSGLSSKRLVIAALVTGVCVSVLESICTGQVYLPTIVFVLRDASLRLHALGYLLLYNLMFVLPLVIIFMLVYFGLRSASLARLAQRHTGTTKLLLAAVLFGLAALLIAAT